jgi:hypothetical protein
MNEKYTDPLDTQSPSPYISTVFKSKSLGGMGKMTRKILVTGRLPEAVLSVLAERFEGEFQYVQGFLPPVHLTHQT